MGEFDRPQLIASEMAANQRENDEAANVRAFEQAAARRDMAESFVVETAEPTTLVAGGSALEHQSPAVGESGPTEHDAMEDAPVMDPNRATFSMIDVNSALEAVPGIDDDTKQRILGALYEQVEARREELAAEEYTDTVVSFATVYERAAGEHASDSNIEGWHESLEEYAEMTLRALAGRQELDETQSLLRDTAARAYAFLRLQQDSAQYVSDEILQAAGTSKQEIAQAFRQGIRESIEQAWGDRPGLDEAVHKSHPDFRSFEYGHSLTPELWSRVIAPVATRMRTSMLAAGYQLPELDEHGKYGPQDSPDL